VRTVLIFTPDEVAALRAAVPPDAADAIDDPTWHDLLLPRYAEMLAPGTSIFGREGQEPGSEPDFWKLPKTGL